MWQEALAARLRAPFDGWVRAVGPQYARRVADVCFLAGHSPCLRLTDGERVPLRGSQVTAPMLADLLAHLCGYSFYACQDRLAQGYLTLPGGFRVGFGGGYGPSGLDPQGVQAVVVRVARACPGCAAGLMRFLPSKPCGVLIASAPGLGKTTLLRDLVRQLSQEGRWVGLCDERGEVAALSGGAPALDVGPCTVVDGGPKEAALGRLVRAVHPDLLAADELGGVRDALSVLEARRCGVACIATAHGATLEELRARPGLRALLEARAFDRVAFLGPRPGQISAVYDGRGTRLYPFAEPAEKGLYAVGGSQIYSFRENP